MEYSVQGYIKVKVALDVEAESEEQAIKEVKEMLVDLHHLDSNIPAGDLEKWNEFALTATEYEDD